MEIAPYQKNRFSNNQVFSNELNPSRKNHFWDLQSDFPQKRMRCEEKQSDFSQKLEFNRFSQFFERFERFFSEENQEISKFYSYIDKMMNSFESFPLTFQEKCENCENLSKPDDKLLHFAQALNEAHELNESQLMICETFGVLSTSLLKKSQNSPSSSKNLHETLPKVPKPLKINFLDFFKSLPKVEESWKLVLKVQRLENSFSIKQEILKNL